MPTNSVGARDEGVRPGLSFSCLAYSVMIAATWISTSRSKMPRTKKFPSPSLPLPLPWLTHNTPLRTHAHTQTQTQTQTQTHKLRLPAT